MPAASVVCPPAIVFCTQPVAYADTVWLEFRRVLFRTAPAATWIEPFEVPFAPASRSVPACTANDPSLLNAPEKVVAPDEDFVTVPDAVFVMGDRKSTRLNSSHTVTSYVDSRTKQIEASPPIVALAPGA